MTTVTIPKKTATKGELVLISRREYEEFLRLQKIFRVTEASGIERRIVARGRKEIQKGQSAQWKRLKNELASRID